MGDFPNIFRKIREQSGLTQQQMADKLGVSRSAIGMYENGEREPNFETLELIADTFNVDMNYLLGKNLLLRLFLIGITLMMMPEIWLNLCMRILNTKFSLTLLARLRKKISTLLSK